MPATTKICPLANTPCDPLSQDPASTANQNCSFFQSDMFNSKCLYIEAMKAMPQIAEGVKKIKISAS